MIEYVVWFIDEADQPEEWAASSSDYEDALHYLREYSQDGRVGLYKQETTMLMSMGEDEYE